MSERKAAVSDVERLTELVKASRRLVKAHDSALATWSSYGYPSTPEVSTLMRISSELHDALADLVRLLR